MIIGLIEWMSEQSRSISRTLISARDRSTRHKIDQLVYAHVIVCKAEPNQKSWGRAEAETESLRPSQANADGRRGKAKAKQAEKLPRGGLEPRQVPRGLAVKYTRNSCSLSMELHLPYKLWFPYQMSHVQRWKWVSGPIDPWWWSNLAVACNIFCS